MKFLKQQNTSKFNIKDQRFFTDQFGLAVMDSNGGLRLPQGTTAQRSDPTKGRWPGISSTQTGDEYGDGTIRYNIDTNSLECLIAGVWEIVRASGSTAISKQQIGPGDGSEIYFGPLTSVPTGTSYQASADNILVLVENVFQISGITNNYTIVQNPPGAPSASFYSGAPTYPTGYYIKFTSAVPASGGGGNPVYVTVYYGYAN